MGWTLLYIAFGGVAVWLLAEVLLQYKARLRWRLLAFGGFAMVVVGVVALSSVVVIALGAAAFAVGQTFVTLSYRRGFTAGWALGGMPGTSRRRREVRPMPPEDADPHLEVSGLEVHEPEPPAYRPEPMPDDTGRYGVYERGAGHAEQPPEEARQEGYGGQEGYGAPYTTGDYTGYPGYGQDVQDGQDGQNGQDVQDGRYAGAYGYGYGDGAGGGQQGHAAYSEAYSDAYADPYAGVPGGPPHDGRDAGGHTSDPSYADGYGTGHPADPYAGQTPPGGVWVPQQRDSEPRPGQYGEYGGSGYGDGAGYGGYDPSSGTGHHYGEQPRH
ncbi:hypothetical protein [Streptomyces sp. DH37]|uniref:hypothetical protein n=1 Tax=Streptomyces sp. DH37 TaxID=3040122 RepID=UPI0024416693|nr:hypothetical protein [Streptomyces sp. DH37]MDG9705805.1 hypothetical protein [Streptomyces sp. DH37]